jgi:hypothetical protein
MRRWRPLTGGRGEWCGAAGIEAVRISARCGVRSSTSTAGRRPPRQADDVHSGPATSTVVARIHARSSTSTARGSERRHEGNLPRGTRNRDDCRLSKSSRYLLDLVAPSDVVGVLMCRVDMASTVEDAMLERVRRCADGHIFHDDVPVLTGQEDEFEAVRRAGPASSTRRQDSDLPVREHAVARPASSSTSCRLWPPRPRRVR